MDIKIHETAADLARTLEDLYRLYVQEMASYVEVGSAMSDFDRHLRGLSKYWDDEAHRAYLIYACGEIAGFCLVREYPGEAATHDIEQFFIVDAFKRKGIGRLALRQILDLYPGKWLIRVLKENERALLFWRQAIEACVGNEYSLDSEPYDRLEMYFFRFRAANLYKHGQ